MKKLFLIMATLLITSMGFGHVSTTPFSNSVAFNIISSIPGNYPFIIKYYINGIECTQCSINIHISCVDIIPSVTLCDQTWMTKNLDVTTYRNGDPIPEVTNATQWANLTTGAWCYYNNDPAMGAIYGKLYNWYSVNDPRRLAPTGWHVPSDAEWTTLTDCLGGVPIAGGKMKAIGTTTWVTPNTAATNSSGWTGLPGGFRFNTGSFHDVGTYGFWWSSSNNAWSRHLFYTSGIIYSSFFTKLYGFSFRCLKD
jgi:uncharacterized protein (TIGR02145 family)